MNKALSITSPGLDAGGGFFDITIPDQIIVTDQAASRVLANVAMGGNTVTVPIADVTLGPGLKWWPGQTIRVADNTTPAGETQVINVGGVNPATGVITIVGVWGANYTVAANARLLFPANPGPPPGSPRVKVTVTQPPPTANAILAVSWAVTYTWNGGSVIRVTVQLGTTPGGVLTWAVAASADVLGMQFLIEWDAE
jgi:hypothetical protein